MAISTDTFEGLIQGEDLDLHVSNTGETWSRISAGGQIFINIAFGPIVPNARTSGVTVLTEYIWTAVGAHGTLECFVKNSTGGSQTNTGLFFRRDPVATDRWIATLETAASQPDSVLRLQALGTPAVPVNITVPIVGKLEGTLKVVFSGPLIKVFFDGVLEISVNNSHAGSFTGMGLHKPIDGGGGIEEWDTLSFSPSPGPAPRVVVAKGQNAEFTSYISPDGIVYPFHTPHNLGRWIISESGWGTPPINYVTQRGPFQNGVTVKDFFLQPRVIQLLIRQGFCDRDALWAGRAGLLDEIRPNRQTIATAVVPGELRRGFADGRVRSLEVFIAEGPRFEPAQINVWDAFAFQEVLRFIAHNPVVFDPTRNDVTFNIGLESNLVFPIDFPIQFGTGVIDDTQNITYVGTWETLPIIIITGPIQLPRIDNVTTGEKLQFSTDIANGQIVTIDLSYGSKTVVDQNGANLIGGLTADSDLATFHIAPTPEAALGVNQIRLQGSNANGATAVEIRYFDRYFGI